MKKHGEYTVYGNTVHEEVDRKCMAEQDGEVESSCSLGIIAFFYDLLPNIMAILEGKCCILGHFGQSIKKYFLLPIKTVISWVVINIFLYTTQNQ